MPEEMNQQPFQVEMKVHFTSFRPMSLEIDEMGLTKLLDHALKFYMANGTEIQIENIECEAGNPADLM